MRLIAFCLAILGACAHALPVDAPSAAMDPVRVALSRLSPADAAYAFRDTVYGFVSYLSDGTARGDSARRILAAALWDLEGQVPERGARLVDVAVAFGAVIPDSAAYHDLDAGLQLLRRPRQRLAMLREVSRRWPMSRWAWERQASLLQELGRASETAAARAHAATLP